MNFIIFTKCYILKMTRINLDDAVKLEVKAIKGDDFGPIQFIFEEAIIFNCNPDCDCIDEVNYELQDLKGAYFEGELLKGDKIVHYFTDEELIFYETSSTLLMQLSSSVTSNLPCTVLKINIRQIIDNIVSTRITGKILFI